MFYLLNCCYLKLSCKIVFLIPSIDPVILTRARGKWRRATRIRARARHVVDSRPCTCAYMYKLVVFRNHGKKKQESQTKTSRLVDKLFYETFLVHELKHSNTPQLSYRQPRAGEPRSKVTDMSHKLRPKYLLTNTVWMIYWRRCEATCTVGYKYDMYISTVRNNHAITNMV